MEINMIYITCATIEEAKKIASSIVKERLAACANLIENIHSFYWWEGKFEEDREAAIIAKTKSSLVPELIKRVKDLHSYECPCIVILPIVEGNIDFLKWILKETKD